MKIRLPALCVLALGVLGFAQQSFACGEKFLIVGRGSRFQRGYVALHPASVLLLKYPSHRAEGPADTLSLPATASARRRCGPAPEAMKSGNPDLILADVTDASRSR